MPDKIYDHEKIAKAIRKVIAKENPVYPFSDMALKTMIEAKYSIPCGNARQIWLIRNANDIPNKSTRLWLYEHGSQTTKK